MRVAELIVPAMACCWLAPALAVPASGVDPIDLAVASYRDCELPDDLQEAYTQERLSDRQLGVRLERLRGSAPQRYGVTRPPPVGARPIPDHAPMATLLLVYPGNRKYVPAYLAMLRAATPHGRVRLNASRASERHDLLVLMRAAGVDLDRVDLVSEPDVESIWVRDYGPIPLRLARRAHVLDTRYSVDCVINDAYPTLTALPGQPVWRAPFYLDGGNLAVDDHGTCFTTTGLLDDNDLDEAEMAALLKTWVGCQKLVVLQPLAGDVINHVDMLLAVGADGSLLLASFDPKEDPENDRVMRRNREILRESQPPGVTWKLVDLPSPPPQSQPGEESLVRTFANLLPFNGVVMVPGYSQVGLARRDLAHERIRAAFPGRTIREIPSDAIIARRGAVHCVGRGVPAIAPSPAVTSRH